MTYEQFVYEAFKEHHSSLGLDQEEINDLIQENSFSKIESYLTKQGYNLSEYYQMED